MRRAVAAGARLPVAAAARFDGFLATLARLAGAADARRGAGAAEAGARGVADARAGAGWLARLAALRAGRVERALAAVSAAAAIDRDLPLWPTTQPPFTRVFI